MATKVGPRTKRKTFILDYKEELALWKIREEIGEKRLL